AADAVLERRDDLAARRVILWVGGEAEHDIEGQTHRISFDLDVAFLHDVEQAHLHLAGEIRQFIQRENSTIRPRQHAVVHRQLVAEDVPAARGLDRVEVADDVGDSDVGRRQLLDVALFRIEPRNRGVVAGLVEEILSVLGDRCERIVIDLAAGDYRQRRIEQRGERAKNSGLRLSAQSEQNEIVAAEKSVHYLRHDRLFVADHAVKDRLTCGEPREEIGAKLILDGLLSSLGRTERGTLQCAKCFWVRRQLILPGKFTTSLLIYPSHRGNQTALPLTVLPDEKK